MSFTGTVAIITGGCRGIGRAIVLELIASDVKVAFTYHNNRQVAETLWKEVQEQGGETMGFQQDVTDFEGAKAVFAAVKERFGRIDMLVNRAGITRDKPLAMMQEEDWRAVIETNLWGCCRRRYVRWGMLPPGP
jgi:3-oxoacyl-[acyl-carrier protein] reductase